MNSDERRILARFHIEMPVSLQVSGSETIVQGSTRDVSATGVFFYTSFELVQGSDIDFIMTLPPELTHTTGIQLSCKGKVVRVQHDIATGRIGVGAAIHCFEFVGAGASSGAGGD